MYRNSLILFASLILLVSLSVAAIHEPSLRGSDFGQLFRTSDVCMGCHNNLVTPAGEDVSIGANWRASMMANSARDPYWHAGVRREVTDHPQASAAIQDECSTCHMPMATFVAHAGGGEGEVFARLPVGKLAATRADMLAADGVSCTMCHQITSDKFGTEDSFTGGFVVDTRTPYGQREIFGPYAVDQGRVTIMYSASKFQQTQSTHLQESEMCATCHTLYTHSLSSEGEVIGELPEQVPYLEWKHSAYREERSCQSCHMPVVADSMAITSAMGQPRAGFSRHTFRGGNFFMSRMLNRYRDQLGVTGLPHEMEAAANRAIQHLQTSSARLLVNTEPVEDNQLVVEVVIENLAGHKLPTAYPSRRAWVHLTVLDRNGDTVFESGALRTDGSISGNDNDLDPERYEPHYREITGDDQVQIYESIMADPDGRVTTGLLTAVRFIKDNRILPKGFDKHTAEEDIAVQGNAANDADFLASGDRVRYVVDVLNSDGPFQVQAELMYQPIAYRWAHNLGSYDTQETNRFVGYYESMAGSSAEVLAKGLAVTR